MTDPRSTESRTKTPEAISLPVLGDSGPAPRRIRRSKMGPRRAAVLIFVHVAIAAHIIHWKIAGRTLSPVEPSEAMQTLNNGYVNAGFIFFVAAILATLIFGRFFCGWACHIVALQDLCAWMLKKVGIRPAPFHSRLLMFAPLILALYMFVWPSAKRLIAPWVAGWWPTGGAYLGPVTRIPREGLTNHLLTDDFWGTFASVPIAIPFLLICGFATVYFLGAKGFCTYGCPYGGFFAPADLVAPGRIVVDSEKCDGHGHCTAVCTSNVRVHEEIREYGMVVSPGCMKCMDCVSVCPTNALSFKFARPAVAKGAAKNNPPKARFDTTRGQDIVLALVFIGVFLAARGQYGVIPMLMAMGIAAIATFLAWKCMQLIARRDLRVVRVQVKRAGRVTPAGAGFIAVMILLGVLTAHSFWLNQYKWRGGAVFNRLLPDASTLATTLGAGVPPDQAARARRGAALYERSLAIGDGGLGLFDHPTARVRASVLNLMAGDAVRAEHLVAPLSVKPDTPTDVVTYHARLLLGLGRQEDALTLLENRIAAKPRDFESRELWASTIARSGPSGAQRIREEAASALTRIPEHDLKARARTTLTLGMAERFLGDPERSRALIRQAAELAPNDRVCLESLGRMQLMDLGRPEEAAQTLRRVFEMDPTRLDAAIELARALSAAQLDGDATSVFDQASAAGAERARVALAQMTLGAELYRWRPEAGRRMIGLGIARAPEDARVRGFSDQIRSALGPGALEAPSVDGD